MKKSSIILIFLFAFGVMNGQNLVQNPSFETVNTGNLICSWYLSQAEFNNAISNWTCPTDGTTDIFHSSLAVSCFSHPLSTNGSAVGQQSPRTGSAMTAICTYGNGGCSPWREYVQGSLSSALVPGQQYCVEFYVSLADYSTYATNNIGVYFTTSAWSTTNGGCPYLVTPQVNYTGPIITNKTAWTLISFTFIPTAAYTRFTIGNFYNDGATSAVNTGGTESVTRYFIDDVDIHLCSSAPTVTVNNPSICAGQTATLTASGATTYAWSTGASTSSISVSPATTTSYTVTGTAAGGTNTAVATVTVNSLPTVSASSSPATICSGSSATLTASGASTYSWSTGGSGSSISVTPASTTTYTVTGTNAASCTGTSTVSVTVASFPSVSVSASPASVCPGSSSTLTASGATTYSWSTGGSGTSISVTPATTSTYTVTGTSGAGCTGTATISVVVNTAPTVSVSGATICQGASATLTASGAAIYSWNTGASTTSVTVSPATTTTYTVTGTNALGCTGSTTVTVTVNSNPVVSASASPASVCPGNSSTLTGSGANTYAWSTGGNGSSISVSPSATTTYTVTGTSVAGCTGTGTVSVSILPGPVVSATGATTCAGTATSISASGATNYTWSDGSSGSPVSVSPATTTTYTVSGTDGSGCTGLATAVVTVNPLPVVTIADQSVCNGFPADLSASGANSYLWDNGSSSNPLHVTPASTTVYSVTGTDANGCTSTAEATVTVFDLPVITSVTATDDYCSSSNGTASCVVSGGTAPYSYSWNSTPVQTGDVATGLSSGQYNVSVADANGCTDNASVTVLASAAFTLTSATEVEHCSHSDGSATITANNALYPLTYSWSHNASLNNATASGLQAGSYTVTVSDGTCAVSLTITVGSYAGPVAGFHADHTVLSMEDGPVSFSDMSYDAVSWFYDFGDGDASTDQNPSHLFSNPGTFNTMQIVADEFGCTDTAYQDIIVKEGFAFFVPSAFSPNGDGRNDMFEVYGYGIDLNTFNLAVFDRWGEMVFQTTDINKMWDGGRANAREQEDVAQAVYSYHITFKTLAGKDKEYFGHVVALP